MADGQTYARSADPGGRRRSNIGVGLAFVALVVIGGPVTLVAMFVLAFSADACGVSGGPQPICSGAVQTLVFLSPGVAWTVGIALAVTGAIRCRDGRRDAWPWLLAAAALPIAGIFGSVVLARWGF